MTVQKIKTDDSDNYTFNPLNFGCLNFSIKASNDAHIALSTTINKPPKYEIFIGGWGNTKSSISKDQENPEKIIAYTPNILSGSEARGFWIKWNCGFISVGKQGKEKPFMSWQDEEFPLISYFGVRTNWKANGVWTIEDDIYINTDSSVEYIYKVILHGSISFSVDSANDAHIALTTKAKESDPMVEVIIGGWENSASAIRYNKQTPDKVHIDTPQILCKDTAKNFVISWKDDLIEVFNDNSKLFEWENSRPFSISHYGVRTSCGAVGNWHIYGAADNQFKIQVVSNPKPIEEVNANNEKISPNAQADDSDANDEKLYVIRAKHSDILIPGKLISLHDVNHVPCVGVENPKENYEILCNFTGKWVKVNNGEIPVGALSSGYTEDGEKLFVGRGEHEGSLIVGKVQRSQNICYVPFDGKEVTLNNYEVLVV